MTKTDALLMMLQMVQECRTHSDDGGCRHCPFGCGKHCLASDGNDIPSSWLVTEKVYEWMAEGSDKE